MRRLLFIVLTLFPTLLVAQPQQRTYIYERYDLDIEQEKRIKNQNLSINSYGLEEFSLMCKEFEILMIQMKALITIKII